MEFDGSITLRDYIRNKREALHRSNNFYWGFFWPTWAKIYITTRPGNTISLIADTSDTIRDLKLKIPPSEWNHGDLPDLVYNGVYLNDNHTLESYNIFQGSTLECRSGPKISITTMSGETISLEVASSNTTIGNLKAQVQDKVGVPQFQQRLFFDGRHLDNNCIIADYKIMDGSTLLLMRRSKGWIPIYVKTHDGKTISLQVKISDTIGDFKFKLKEVGGIDPFKQVLFFTGDQLLNNNCTLNDYNIHHVSLSSFCLAGSAADYYHRLRDISVAADDSFHRLMDTSIPAGDFVHLSKDKVNGNILPSSLQKFAHLRIPREEIKSAASNFDNNNIIGLGGYGKVYSGELSHSGKSSIVAIKRLHDISRHGDNQFRKELSILSSAKHENIFSLIGYCDENDERIIVYKHAARGTLDQYLSHPTLTWSQRLKISVDVARGLEHIHRDVTDRAIIRSKVSTDKELEAKVYDFGLSTKYPESCDVRHTIIHRDVKSSNIPLDDNWAAKVSDFGLSKIVPTMDHTHVSTDVYGSSVYLDPEYDPRKKLTEKLDLYDFGVLLFEILCSPLAHANEGTSSRRLKEMKASLGRNVCSRFWDSILECRSKVSVRTMSGKTISLNVRPSDTIRDLKLKIPLSEWIYSDLPNLFYKGEHLNDNRTLDSYNISWLSTLECRLGLNISIRAMSGKTVSVKVASSNTTISNLKAKFQDKEGVPQFQQKLFFNGRQLENKRTLADYKIEDGSTLLLVRRSKGWIPIYVETHTGKTISREVKSSDTIGDVKVNITDMVGVPPYNQTLFFAGEELLDNDRTLYDYHIHSESTLSLVPVCRGRMKIYAETIDGNTIPLNVISRNTIGEVKSLIQDKEGIPTHTQTLVYAGQELDDSRTLVYYLIQNETTLRLVDNTLMRREPMQIHVEIVATGRTIPLQVQTFDTINSVKSKIQSQEDIPYEQQRLFLPQIQLKDNCTLADYYIQNESTLHLVVTLIKIAVKTPAGKIIILDVDSSDTIWNVKAKIQDVEEIPRDHQKLFLAEEREQLQNSLTLAKCCVKTESTLYLLVTSDKKGV